MTTLVIDASVAVKWIVAEQNSTAALALRSTHRFFAPDLLVAECANILWKKVQHGEVLPNELDLAARLVQRFPIEFVFMRDVVPTAFQLAVETAHPAYDCFYLALAADKDLPFVTADRRLLNKIRQGMNSSLKRPIHSIEELCMVCPGRHGTLGRGRPFWCAYDDHRPDRRASIHGSITRRRTARLR